MTGENRNILNRILLNWPQGTVGTLKWFRDRGGYQQLLDYYQKALCRWENCLGIIWKIFTHGKKLLEYYIYKKYH